MCKLSPLDPAASRCGGARGCRERAGAHTNVQASPPCQSGKGGLHTSRCTAKAICWQIREVRSAGQVGGRARHARGREVRNAKQRGSTAFEEGNYCWRGDSVKEAALARGPARPDRARVEGLHQPRLSPAAAKTAAAAALSAWRWALNAAHSSVCPCFQPIAAQGPLGQYRTLRQPLHASSLGTPAREAARPHVAHV